MSSDELISNGKFVQFAYEILRSSLGFGEALTDEENEDYAAKEKGKHSTT